MKLNAEVLVNKEYEDGNAIAGDNKRMTTLGNMITSRGLV